MIDICVCESDLRNSFLLKESRFDNWRGNQACCNTNNFVCVTVCVDLCRSKSVCVFDYVWSISESSEFDPPIDNGRKINLIKLI